MEGALGKAARLVAPFVECNHVPGLEEELDVIMGSASNNIGRNAFSTVATAFLGMGTSVLLDAIVIGYFGMGWQTDAYFIAITIPTIITTILAIQAARVIQPIFIRKRETEGEQAGWQFLNLMLTNGLIVMASIALVGVFASRFV